MKCFFTSILCLCLSACSFLSKEKEPVDYIHWLNDETNGLVKKKYINGLQFTVKYLTPEYLAYQELRDDKKYSQSRKDSLVKNYSQTKTFLLSIAPDEREEGKEVTDVMYLGIKNMEDYKSRAMQMNFEIKDHVQLKVGYHAVYTPVLTNMENTYGLGSGRSIVCVFSPLQHVKEFEQTKSIDLIWDDEVFQSGRNHFVFDNKDFSSIPQLKF